MRVLCLLTIPFLLTLLTSKCTIKGSPLKNTTNGSFTTDTRNKFHLKVDLIESLGCSWPSKEDVRKFYHLIAFVDYNAVFNAKVELNHENWPLFQHFVRLITDPFVYFGQMALTPQNDVFNLLRREINPDFCHLRCRKFELNLDGDSQNFFSWIKDHVLCSKFNIWNYYSGCFSQGQLPEAVLVDFFLTGALCTSEFKVKHGAYPFKIIIEFLQKFMDLKSCDEYQVVESIEWKVETGSVEELKRECAKFVVKEEGNHRTFEFVNNDIGKKLQITHKNSDNPNRLAQYHIKFSKI
ncbi:hypothetical protein Ddc_18641 [Ditylenchus destructor]|nr:hypothetical protein Ddc_18641 [Ditylenchus destructor]